MRVLFVSEQRPPRKVLLQVLKEVLAEKGWREPQVVTVRFKNAEEASARDAFDLIIVDVMPIIETVARIVRVVGERQPHAQMLGFIGHNKLVSANTPASVGLADRCLMLGEHQLDNRNDLYCNFFAARMDAAPIEERVSAQCETVTTAWALV